MISSVPYRVNISEQPKHGSVGPIHAGYIGQVGLVLMIACPCVISLLVSLLMNLTFLPIMLLNHVIRLVHESTTQPGHCETIMTGTLVGLALHRFVA